MTEGIVAVTSMIIGGMEKTVSPADFIPDAMEMMFVKSSGIADETEIITVETSINRSGLEMIEAISRSIDGLLCAVHSLRPQGRYKEDDYRGQTGSGSDGVQPPPTY